MDELQEMLNDLYRGSLNAGLKWDRNKKKQRKKFVAFQKYEHKNRKWRAGINPRLVKILKKAHGMK